MNFCNVVPGGVVCFFPSFSYMEVVVGEWKKGDAGGVWERIEGKKHVGCF